MYVIRNRDINKMEEIVNEISNNYNSDLSIKENLKILTEKGINYDIDSILLYIAVNELKELEE